MTTMMARWGIYVTADDPIVAADKAAQIVQSASSNHWTITNLDTQETVVVDLNNRKVIPPE